MLTVNNNTCAKEADSGVTAQLRTDLEAYTDFYGNTKPTPVSKSRSTAETTADPETSEPLETTQPLITYSEYETVADLLTSWYIQEFITPLHVEQEAPFNPLDPNQVDLTVKEKK